MILVYGKNPVGNIIHIALGPESDLWSDLHGALTVDITPLLQVCDENVPVLLNITKCASELKLANNMGAAAAAGAQYPFLPGTAVFAPQLHNNQSVQEATDGGGVATAAGQQHGKSPQAPQAKQVKANKKQARKADIRRGKCSRCPDEDAELIPDLSPAICFSCARIDLYQARKTQPLGNPGELQQGLD